jgi:hypothetical protein
MRDRIVDTRGENRSKWICLAAAICFASLCSRADILEHWTTNLVSSTAGMRCVVYGNGRYVAFGEYSDYGLILSSEDGKNWTQRSDGGSSGISYSIGLTYAGGKFFALGGFGTSGVSDNGISWDTFSFPGYGTASSVAFGATLYVAACDSNFSPDFGLAGSGDGRNWTNLAPSGPIGGVAYGAGRFVAVGVKSHSGQSYTSTTGRTWILRTIPGGSDISFQNGIFIVPYAPGTNLISSDGINWAFAGTGLAGSIGKVLFSKGIYLSRVGANLVASANGTNWVQYASVLPGDSTWQLNFATDGARIVTAGIGFFSPPYYHGFIYTSDELVGIRLSGGSPPTMAISGLVGRQYGLDVVDEMPATGNPLWHQLTTFPLLFNPTVIVDNTATNLPQRFYRAVLLP